MAAGGAGAFVAVYDVDPDTIAALVLACPAVAGLSGGPYGAAATYLVGRKVAGVRINPDTVEVHVVSRFGPTVGELAEQIRAALAGRVLGRTVDIVVEDLADRPHIEPTPGQAGLPGEADGAEMTARLGGPPIALPLAGGTGLVLPGTSPTADQVVDPVEVLLVDEVPGTLSAPPDLPATRPSRWTRPGRQG